MCTTQQPEKVSAWVTCTLCVIFGCLEKTGECVSVLCVTVLDGGGPSDDDGSDGECECDVLAAAHTSQRAPPMQKSYKRNIRALHLLTGGAFQALPKKQAFCSVKSLERVKYCVRTTTSSVSSEIYM